MRYELSIMQQQTDVRTLYVEADDFLSGPENVSFYTESLETAIGKVQHTVNGRKVYLSLWVQIAANATYYLRRA